MSSNQDKTPPTPIEAVVSALSERVKIDDKPVTPDNAEQAVRMHYGAIDKMEAELKLTSMLLKTKL